VKACEARVLAALLESGGGTFRSIARWCGRTSRTNVAMRVSALRDLRLVSVAVPHKRGRRGHPARFAPTEAAWRWAERLARGDECDRFHVLGQIVEALEAREGG